LDVEEHCHDHALLPAPRHTRSRAVAHDGIVYAVATAKNKAAPLYEQTLDALAEIDKNLADAGSHKSRILRATSTSPT
jgi:enamine deaminase RidA (YjgF/YER057c/UK114 family)